MSEQLTFPEDNAALLEPYLPPRAAPTPAEASPPHQTRPFVTLTFATSLDSSLSLAPGVRTRLSGTGSKAMTHYLRSRHAAILIGVSTLVADSPALNCRITTASPAFAPASQPRPIIIDPHLRWTPDPTDNVLDLARRGLGKAPFVLTGVESSALPAAGKALLERLGGKYIHVAATPSGADGRLRFNWRDVFGALRRESLDSIMVEGGGYIINSLLDPACHELVDAVIVTIAPTWLGQGGVVVSPDSLTDAAGVPVPVARLSDVSWHPLGQDVVLCGKLHT
ncbi:Fc.00g089470.m01.CDS01 [Cosmosporella sp. VM-42]